MVKAPTRTNTVSGRRRVPAVAQADAESIPDVRQVSDPGVSAPQQAFGSDVGDALQAAGATTFDAATRIRNAEEGVARDRDDTAYSQALSETFQEAQANADLSDQKVIDNLASKAETLQKQILGSHAGGFRSQQALQTQLERRRIQFADQLAVQSTIARRDKLGQSFDKRLSGIVTDSLTDPDIPIEQRFAQVDEAVEFLSLPPDLARTAKQSGREKIAAAHLNMAITRGEVDENGLLSGAREMLENPILRDVLQPGVRSAFRTRIATIEREIQSKGAEVQAEVAALDSLAGRLGLEGEDKQDFMVGMLSKGKVTDKQSALNRLVQKGLTDQNTADKISAGVLRPIPLRNEFGEVEDIVVVDLSASQGKTASAGEGSGAAPAPAPAAPSTVTEVPAAEPEPAVQPSRVPQPPENKSLFGIAAGDVEVTGLGPAVLEGLQNVLGQADISVADPEQQVFRKNFDNAKRRLATSLVPNSRFPQKQVEFILDTADIGPGGLKDRQSLITSIVALDQSLATEQQQAETDAIDKSLPSKVRKEQASNARAIKNFRDSLGVPEGISPDDIKNIEPAKRGGLNAVIEFGKEIMGLAGGKKGEEVPTLSTQKEVDGLKPGQRFIWGPTGGEMVKTGG